MSLFRATGTWDQGQVSVSGHGHTAQTQYRQMSFVSDKSIIYSDEGHRTRGTKVLRNWYRIEFQNDYRRLFTKVVVIDYDASWRRRVDKPHTHTHTQR